MRINKIRIDAYHDNEDIKVNRTLINANQFLEIATVKNVRIESTECSGMKILAKKIFLDGDIVSSGPIVLAAMEIRLNRKAVAVQKEKSTQPQTA
jgi:hypothetical protein